MENAHGFPPLPAIAAVLVCAALMGGLYQALFPRPARWAMVLTSAVLGGALTVSLTYLLSPTAQRLAEITDLWSALRVVVPTVGLPEEAVKGLAALIAVLTFRRAATPAEAFQTCLFAALGFAVVENALYARAFAEVSVLIAFGRGIVASFIHGLMMMIQGTFMARFVATGFRRWHLPVLGWLCAAMAHAGFDWGMLQPLTQYFELTSRHADPTTIELAMAGAVVQNLPVLAIGIPAPFLIGLYLFRRALRQAGRIELERLQAQGEGTADAAAYAARIAVWRRAGNALMILGAVGLIVSIAIAVWLSASGAMPPPSGPPAAEMKGNLPLTIAIILSPASLVLGWLLRQKR